jgi:hypothetical protein
MYENVDFCAQLQLTIIRNKTSCQEKNEINSESYKDLYINKYEYINM